MVSADVPFPPGSGRHITILWDANRGPGRKKPFLPLVKVATIKGRIFGQADTPCELGIPPIA